VISPLAAEKHAAVECIDVRRNFQDGSRVIKVLQGTDLKVYRGEFVAIVGASGSGKTTLLNLIGGLDTPTSGTILVDGQDITKLNDEQMSEVRRHKIGVLFQDQHLLPIFTALENVEVPMLLDEMKPEERKARAIKLLELMLVDHRSHHMPHELSGGMRSRVALARALAMDPAVLLCDEPTGDLDHTTGAEIIQLMRDLAKKQNRAVIAATHDPETARMADRILLLRDGVLVDELVGDYFKPSKIEVRARGSDAEAQENSSS
jgi:putative ABC transport system ATP-binding protein